MCIICDHLDSRKLDPWEAARNRTEMIDQFDDKHLKVLDEKIRAALLDYLDELTIKNELEDNEELDKHEP